jgi:hypothetical protein
MLSGFRHEKQMPAIESINLIIQAKLAAELAPSVQWPFGFRAEHDLSIKWLNRARCWGDRWRLWRCGILLAHCHSRLNQGVDGRKRSWFCSGDGAWLDAGIFG